jgi:hypothetical protein
MANRAFTSDGIPEKADDYHGSCRFVRTSPEMATKGVESVNIELTFEDAMRLSVALQSAVFGLNRYNRGTKEGKRIGLCLSLKMPSRSLAVLEQPIKPPED